MIDDVSFGSETEILPDLQPQQAAGTQVDASDGINYLTDPTSPNFAFTLPQIAFPPLPPQQAARNVDQEEIVLEDIAEENEEHDFGQGINDHNEFISDDPFINPVIDGHEWHVNERSKRSFFPHYAKFC